MPSSNTAFALELIILVATLSFVVANWANTQDILHEQQTADLFANKTIVTAGVYVDNLNGLNFHGRNSIASAPDCLQTLWRVRLYEGDNTTSLYAAQIDSRIVQDEATRSSGIHSAKNRAKVTTVTLTSGYQLVYTEHRTNPVPNRRVIPLRFQSF